MNKTQSSIGIAFATLLLTFIFSDFRLGDGTLNDYFHHGEYFNVLPSIILNNTSPYLSVHGALDYLPAWISYVLVGAEYYVHTTHLFYIIIKLLSCILLLLILGCIYFERISLVCCAFLAPFLVNYRDFSLLLLLFFYLFKKKQHAGTFGYYTTLVLTGLASTFNLFYSTNRGIAGSVAIFVALVIDSYYDKRNVISICIFILTALFANVIISTFSLSHLIEQIPFLLQNTERWGYSHNSETVGLSLHIGLLIFLSALLVIIKFLNIGAYQSDLSNVVLIVILSLFYYQIATYRADIYHTVMGFIIVLINIFYFFKLNSEYSLTNRGLSFYILLSISAVSLLIIHIRPLVILLPLLIFNNFKLFSTESRNSAFSKFTYIILFLIFSILGFRIIDQIWSDRYLWLTNSPLLKRNASVLTDEILWAQKMLITKKAPCLFDMTNSGLINSIATLPNCTKYSYIAFANPKDQHELIHELEFQDPKAIVTHRESSYFEINGNTMEKSYPILNTFIEENYPNMICKDSLCVRSK
jgi:hypothetical protein